MLLEIVRTPHGTSPSWVRDAWVGVQFEALRPEPVTIQTRAAGSGRTALAQFVASLQGKSIISEKRGYPTNARNLLGLLALRSEKAALWYIENAPQMLDFEQVFILEEECCQPICDLAQSAGSPQSFPFEPVDS